MKLYRLSPLLVLFSAHLAHAAEPLNATSNAPPIAPQRHWYGWQTAVVDAASLGFSLTMTQLDQGSGRGVQHFVTGVGVSSYVLGGPIVHAANGHWRKAAASVGLRVSAPVVGVALGLAIGPAVCSKPDGDIGSCRSNIAYIGLFAGIATAVIVDSAGLAYEPEPKATPTQGVRFAPVIIAERNRWGAGFGGTF